MHISAKLDYKKLKNARVEKDITQKILSEKLHINLNTLKSIETGRTKCNKETLKKLTDELEINIDELYIEDFHLTNVISIVNSKGGSGKTSVAGSLAYALSEQNNLILLIDSDMQMNLTHSFGLDKNKKNLGNALLNEESLETYIIKTKYDQIDMVVSDLTMCSVELELLGKMQRENILKYILEPIIKKGKYDFIIIDTSPTLGILNLNVLNASNFCIIPVTTDKFGLENINTVLNFITNVQEYNKNLKNVKILLNKFDTRKNEITLKCKAYLQENFGAILLSTIISIDRSMQNAQYNNVPVLDFKTNSRVAKEYRRLCKEIIKLKK
ncbi:AAA family ATPase [Clostridium sp.]|uniref:AAA family ATPase n=1 Tax=Clostridium sp. TaxID=1506 RepID=UPI001A4A352B|nr:AAA family ATPase [Clostridium sp.]MBK5237326.1 AAA family ATPase [Clostridium sp.]